MLRIKKKNEVHFRVECDDLGIQKEIHELFSFKIKDAFWHPLVKQRKWDGIKHLFDYKTHLLYVGLLPKLLAYLDEKNYDYILDAGYEATEFPAIEAIEFIKSLKLPYTVTDYQFKYFLKAVRNRRLLILAPTGSGKSLILYLLIRFFNLKTLLCVPTTGLVEQMYDDFKHYGWDVEKFVHKVRDGDKFTDKQVTLCCWQSIYRIRDQKFWSQFDLFLGDESHQYQASSLISIMENLKTCRNRFGTSGTLNDSQCDKMILEGLFGEIYQVTTTKQLIDENKLSKLLIKNIILKYDETTCREMVTAPYKAEIDFLLTHKKRNEYIAKLVASPMLEGTTLVMFQYVKRGNHGQVLFDLIRCYTNRPVFLIHGQTPAEDREEVRKIVQQTPEAIIVASSGVFSMGVNIPSLKNLVLTSPSKARVRLLQSIGRMLRKSEKKDRCVIYDVADDLSWKRSSNTTFKHFKKRVVIYYSEKFPFRTYRISL